MGKQSRYRIRGRWDTDGYGVLYVPMERGTDVPVCVHACSDAVLLLVLVHM